MNNYEARPGGNNHGGLGREAQGLSVMPGERCPACDEPTMVALANAILVATGIAGGNIQETPSVYEFHILCFHCLYRADWVLNGADFSTVWESQVTEHPRGGLVTRES
ncbi:MAG: hypothetical protein ABIH46_14120 [Chloroflexota bacterium]